MVVKGRSIWRGSLAGIAAILFFALNFPLGRVRAVQNSNSSSQQTPTSQHKKTKRHSKPKPLKPVPLGELEPVPMEMGEGNQNPLETFFQALANLESPPTDAPQPPVVRIIHFGDSHVASDYWAGILREKLQARFGDAGPGFVLPGRPWPSIRYVEAKSLDGQGWRADGLRYIENDGVVGLGGMSLESNREASPASALATFSHFQILAATSPGTACFQVQVDDLEFPNLTSKTEHVVPTAEPPPPAEVVPEPSSKSLGGGAGDPPDPPAPLAPVKRGRKRRKPTPPMPPFKPWPPDSPLDLLEISSSTPLAAGPHTISIRSSCGGQARLLGLELDNGVRGVIYDNYGVNGARLADLEKPLPALRKALLVESHPALIIVSYGTNDIGTKGFTPSGYEERAYQILSKLKEDAGDASILVTGPTDRGSPRRKTRAFIQQAQAELQPALRKAALRAGCAYWDEQAAMGGPGSMTRWVRAGLANYDYVHFSSLGYQKLADMLYDQIMAEYSNFQKAKASE